MSKCSGFDFNYRHLFNVINSEEQISRFSRWRSLIYEKLRLKIALFAVSRFCVLVTSVRTEDWNN
jgi:hypothetical protein